MPYIDTRLPPEYQTNSEDTGNPSANQIKAFREGDARRIAELERERDEARRWARAWKRAAKKYMQMEKNAVKIGHAWYVDWRAAIGDPINE